MSGGNHGPYVQSERLGLYDQHVDTLMGCGHAYRCFCTSDRLTAVRKLASRTGQRTAYDGACRELHADQVILLLPYLAFRAWGKGVRDARTVSISDGRHGRMVWCGLKACLLYAQ